MLMWVVRAVREFVSLHEMSVRGLLELELGLLPSGLVLNIGLRAEIS